jgi:V/A-type H+-transporting ATPase subunit C
MTRRGDDTRYGFAVGRVMVLRTRLLGHAAFERLLDARTFADQRRVLSETHFGRFIEHAENVGDVERGIDESLRDLYEQFLERSDLPAEVVAYFRRPYDFGVLKSVLKAALLGTVAEMPMVLLGLEPLGAFESPAGLPDALGRTARAVLGAGPSATPEDVDAAIDRAMFAELARLARASRVEFLGRLVERETDVANAKVLLRCAIAGRTPQDARRLLVGKGTWDAASVAEAVSRPDALAEAVVRARVLEAPAVELLDAERLDPLVDAALSRLARVAARMTAGPEPVIAYLLARRAEAVAVRAMLVGRLAGLPREVVAGRMRQVAS